MSNTLLNIRFGSWHLQIVRLGDWIGEISMGRSPITFGHNPIHDRLRHKPGWRWLQIY